MTYIGHSNKVVRNVNDRSSCFCSLDATACVKYCHTLIHETLTH